MHFKPRSKSVASPAVPTTDRAVVPEAPISLGSLTENLPDIPRPSSSVNSTTGTSRSSSSSSGVPSAPSSPAPGSPAPATDGLPPIPRDPRKEKRRSFGWSRGSISGLEGQQKGKQRSNSTPQSAAVPPQPVLVDWAQHMPAEQILRAQYDREGRPVAATEELWEQRATVQCLGYGTPRPRVADAHFGRPPSYYTSMRD